jgi:hypothetical protein
MRSLHFAEEPPTLKAGFTVVWGGRAPVRDADFTSRWFAIEPGVEYLRQIRETLSRFRSRRRSGTGDGQRLSNLRHWAASSRDAFRGEQWYLRFQRL